MTKSVARVVSEVRRTILFLRLKYAFIKISGVPGFILQRLVLIQFRIMFGFSVI